MSENYYKTLFNMSGKTAVVSGGVGILGKVFCEALAEHGANIAIVDINAKDVGCFAARLAKKYGIRCSGIQCDITLPSSVAEMVDVVCEEHGKIDILVNNAAWKSDDLESYFAPYEDYDYDQWRKIMAVNVEGMFLLSHLAQDHVPSSSGVLWAQVRQLTC